MAQSANNPTGPERTSLYDTLRNYIISHQGITTVEQFFGLESSELRPLLKYSVGIILKSDKELQQLDDATSLMLTLAKLGHFEHFRPLITVVLANEAKSNPELFELIKKEFVDPPRHDDPSVTSTLEATGSTSGLVDPPRHHGRSVLVRTGSISGLVNSSTSLSCIIPALRKELKKLMYTDVPDLVNHYTRQHTIDPISLPEIHQ